MDILDLLRMVECKIEQASLAVYNQSILPNSNKIHFGKPVDSFEMNHLF